MGIRVECDWCHQAIPPGTPYITIEIDGKAVRKGGGEAQEVFAPARVYCGSGDGERNCAERLLALLDANPGGPVDMGMEWRLVAVDGEPERPTRARAGDFRPAPEPVAADADLQTFIDSFNAGMHIKLRRAFEGAGYTTLDQLSAVTAEELMAINGIGWTTVTRLRNYVAERDAAREVVQR
jgi:hypothetical protein